MNQPFHAPAATDTMATFAIQRRRAPAARAPGAFGREFSDTQTVHDRSIGDIIREAKGLTDAQVEQVLAYQREHGLRFGESAIALGLANDRRRAVRAGAAVPLSLCAGGAAPAEPRAGHGIAPVLAAKRGVPRHPQPGDDACLQRRGPAPRAGRGERQFRRRQDLLHRQPRRRAGAARGAPCAWTPTCVGRVCTRCSASAARRACRVCCRAAPNRT